MKDPTHFQKQNLLMLKGKPDSLHRLYNNQWLDPLRDTLLTNVANSVQ